MTNRTDATRSGLGMDGRLRHDDLDMTDLNMTDVDMADLEMIDSDLTDRKGQVDGNSHYLLTLHANRDGIQMT